MIKFKNNSIESSSLTISTRVLEVGNTQFSGKVENISNNITDINIFSNLVKTKNFIYKCAKNHLSSKIRLIHNHNEKNELDIILPTSSMLGSGSYGVAFKVENFVIKLPLNSRLEKNFFGIKKEYAQYKRVSSILNRVNQDDDFSRAIELNNGQNVLVSKYIEGESVIDDSAFDFVKSNGLIIYDFREPGNVKKDRDGKYKLIDADHVVQPYSKRRDSIGSEAYYRDFYFDKDV